MALYYTIFVSDGRIIVRPEAAQEEIRDSRRPDALSNFPLICVSIIQKKQLKLSEMANLFGYSDAYLSRMSKSMQKSILRDLFTGNS